MSGVPVEIVIPLRTFCLLYILVIPVSFSFSLMAILDFHIFYARLTKVR